MLWLGLLIAVMVVLVLVWRSGGGVKTASIKQAQGTARLLLIIEALQVLNKRKSQEALQQFWQDTEQLLGDVLLDNTASTRESLVDLLTQAHAYCSNRELAKSLIAMRNALLDAA